MKQSTLAAFVLIFLCASALADDNSSVCKITGYRNARFLGLIPYHAKAWTIREALRDTGTDRELLSKLCSDAAWQHFDRERGSLAYVSYVFTDHVTKKSETGTVLTDNRSLDELIHDKGPATTEDTPSAKVVEPAPPASEAPYGTGGDAPGSATPTL